MSWCWNLHCYKQLCFPFSDERQHFMALADSKRQGWIFIGGMLACLCVCVSVVRGKGDRLTRIVWQLSWLESCLRRVGSLDCLILTTLPLLSLSIFPLIQNKCVRYWPDLHATKEFGKVLVRNVDEQRAQDYILRKLEVTRLDRVGKAVHALRAEPLSFRLLHTSYTILQHTLRLTAQQDFIDLRKCTSAQNL